MITITPTQAMRWIDALLMPLSIICGVFALCGLYAALISSPPDYQQGDAVRMMYVHVPAAWLALGGYMFLASMNAAGLIWKNPLSYTIASSSAPVGACFAFICLVTGSIWGKPIWGTWWQWDARLTSMLVLFFFYLGYMMLVAAYDDRVKGEKMGAILSLVGLVNVPIVKFSVDWWNTLHQPASILRSGGISIATEMLVPLLLMFVTNILLFIIITALKTKTQLVLRKHQRRQISKVYQ